MRHLLMTRNHRADGAHVVRTPSFLGDNLSNSERAMAGIP